ncbi:MAG TPA: ABC transporter permease [Blastocatellia bacterium]|nr:ABC transporter permease [Blastocatellia bacterium]HMY75101.1 ABC transporter permease [Blastocatellia bacterium]HMZ23001.1 ABC transporter permease [Blastocatellia bacterium]HNG28450.1 ABC transporter permease [Blastocatellia bacterium]
MHSLKLLSLLIAKEWRELTASRAYWLLLVLIGPLVGNSFIAAVNLYAEASGIGGGAAALAQGLTPLDGILVPTFGAYELALTLLFPFVAIRLIAAEKESGAWKLALQLPTGLSLTIAAKMTALLAGWLLAWLPGVVAVVLWKSYGGHLYAPESWNLLLGHWLRMLLGSGVAMAAAALAESAASAAILTLSFTLGTWALDFIAAGRGGWPAEIAAYTPVAALRWFEQGLLRLNTVAVMAVITLLGFALTALWMQAGKKLSARLLHTLAAVVVAAAAIWLSSSARASWDVSENRRNSFPRADEQALRQIREPLRITINLAAEDPRLMDYERSILNKLRRVLPRVEAVYAAQSQTGLFEGAGAQDRYGEIWYEFAGRKVMNRSTTVPIVLEQLYEFTGIAPPAAVEEPAFPGYPLAVHPKSAKLIFYVLWPPVALLTWWFVRRKRR